jgi:hypothetical protein
MLIPKRIACLSKLCDPSSQRYALWGVQFSRDENGVPRAVVTDGRCLLETHWSEPSYEDYPAVAGLDLEPMLGFETIIPKDQLVAASKLPPNRSPKEILKYIALDEKNANGTIPVVGTDLETTKRLDIRPAEGRFPKWRDILPDYTIVEQWKVKRGNLSHKAVSIHLDAKTLAKLLLAVLESGEAEGDTNDAVELLVPLDRNKAVVVKRGLSTGVIMPMSGDYGDEHEPEEPEVQPQETEEEVTEPA